eukprot:1143476-Rhodomonas_salina.1
MAPTESRALTLALSTINLACKPQTHSRKRRHRGYRQRGSKGSDRANENRTNRGSYGQDVVVADHCGVECCVVPTPLQQAATNHTVRKQTTHVLAATNKNKKNRACSDAEPSPRKTKMLCCV